MTATKGVPHCKPRIKWPKPVKFRKRQTTGWRIKDLHAAYKVPTNLPGGGVIGILEFGGGWRQSDLDRFANLNNMPKFSAVDVSVDGTTNGSTAPDADAEVALDIQVAAAAYYHATGKVPVIRVYWAENGNFEGCVKQAVADGCDVLSISWGAPESGWDPAAASSLESALASAAAAGLTVFASSGDNSADDGTTDPTVDLPAGLPHAHGCGGTTKTATQELVWGDGSSSDGGTGGGFSQLFKAGWQMPVVVIPAGGGRMVPDFSAVADPETGYRIVLNGQEAMIGGTSGVSPYYAGLFAAMGRKLGHVGPKAWASPTAFTDITQGSNGAYSAATGPDPCTGLGVPNGAALAALFAAPVDPVDPPKPPAPKPEPKPVTFPSYTGHLNLFTGRIDLSPASGSSFAPAAFHLPDLSVLSGLIAKCKGFVDAADDLAAKYGPAVLPLIHAARLFADEPSLATATGVWAAAQAFVPQAGPKAVAPRFGPGDVLQWLQVAQVIEQLLAGLFHKGTAA
jgi:kumamolisin